MESEVASLKALATMEEFEEAVHKVADNNNDKLVTSDADCVDNNDCSARETNEHNDINLDTTSSLNTTQFKTSDMIVALFEDGYYPGEIIDVLPDALVILFMKLKTFNISTGGDSGRRFWYWPSSEVNRPETIPKSVILPAYPNMTLNTKFTSKRTFILELMNSEIIDKMI